MALKSTSPLSGLVRKSPFKPIQEHMEKVFTCVSVLPQLFDALYQNDQAQVNAHAEQIGNLETEADKLKSKFSLNLPTSLLMPVDRKDLLSLISIQDNIADSAEEIGQILTYRDMIVPDELQSLLDELLEATMEIASDANTMIKRLNDLVEVGFGGRPSEHVEKIIAGVRRSEHNIDNIVHRTRRTLFTVEKNLDPVSVMFWYKLIDLLERISNLAENMGDRILLFLSK